MDAQEIFFEWRNSIEAFDDSVICTASCALCTHTVIYISKILLLVFVSLILPDCHPDLPEKKI